MEKKRCFRRIAAALLVCLAVCVLTACSAKLSGTYTTTDELVKQSVTFKDDNIIEVSAFGLNVQGTYVIEDGKITITYRLLNISSDWEKSFRKDGDSIFIDGTEFVKEK